MVLPASGPISLADINTELGRSSTATIGLQQAETGVYAAINQASPNKPDGAAPHAMNEWYNYNHLALPPLTWNSNDNGGLTLSNNNLTATNSTSSWLSIRATEFYSSGTFSFEASVNSGNCLIGIGASNASLTTYTGATANSMGYWGNLSGRIYMNSTNDIARNFGGYGSGDVIKCQINFSNNLVSFFRNGTLMHSSTFIRDGRAVTAMIGLNASSATLLGYEYST
jgi:hypothetical protein